MNKIFNNFEQIFNFFQNICINTSEPIKCAIWIKKEDLDKVRRIIKKNDLSKCSVYRYNQNVISITYKTGSKIDILAPSENTRGLRYTFSVYDATIDDELVNYTIKPTSASGFPPRSFFFKRDKCNHCICKTCALAYENGGAEGCGNCLKCDLMEGCTSCREYYNTDVNQIDYKRRSLNDNFN